jgi:1,4-dihydroxy-2-naphthoate polyprenyltransferase
MSLRDWWSLFWRRALFGAKMEEFTVKLKIWFLETRPQFLVLSIVLSFLGTSAAWYDGSFHLGKALLAFLGLLLCHISVNSLNDYFDYKSGIDLEAKRTPFSGGSGILPPGLLEPRQVFWFGVVSLLLAVPIGVYFVITVGWALLPLLLVGALCVVFYTPFFTRMGWPEWAPGVGLGTLPVLGCYFVQTANYTIPALVMSLPSGILVHNLLFLNEFPDVEADRKAGRKTLPITMGKKRAGVLYSVLTGVVYLWIAGAVAMEMAPVFALIALLTLPLAIKAIKATLRQAYPGNLAVAMKNNVLVVLLTQALLGAGYIIATVL